jgi:hypothetical protein
MLEAGNNLIPDGSLARAIYDNLVTEMGDPEGSADVYRRLASAVAQAVVSHFQSRAEIAVEVTPADGGLQRFDVGAGAVPTLPPATPHVLSGTLE